MLTSSYGKTIEKAHNIQYKIMTEDEMIPYIYRNRNVIKNISKIGDKYFIEQNVEICDLTAYTYIGSLILSMSKRIMNEVMCLAEDNGIQIHYQDTDSMHIDQDNIPKLAKLFE